MPKLTKIRIQNFRSCRDTELPLTDLTPMVGCNNGGKSNIMHAIKWLLKAAKLGPQEFCDPSAPLVVSGAIEGITEDVLKLLGDKRRKVIEPYCPD